MSQSNDKDIIDAVARIRSKFRTETSDPDEPRLSFLDEVNLLIRKIFEDSDTDVYDALQPDMLDKWKNRSFSRKLRSFTRKINPRNIFYFVLLAVITGFLVSEALPFYAIAGAITAKTYVKAVLTEVCFIFLSGFRAIGKIQTVFVGALRASMFAFMLFVISSNVISTGTNTISEISNIQEQIVLLEDQIAKKDELIEFYRNKGWGVNAGKQEEAKDKLADKLFELKQKQITEGKSKEASTVVLYETYGKAFFRIMILLISVLITRRLFKF